MAMQSFFCEEPIFFPQIVADDQITEQIQLPKIHLLGESAGQIEHLSWKGEALPISVKGGQEGVVLAWFEHQACRAFIFQDATQGRFAHTDQAFNGHELRQPEPRFFSDIGPAVLTPEKTTVVAGLKPKPRELWPAKSPIF
jgi:hypothetical protein